MNTPDKLLEGEVVDQVLLGPPSGLVSHIRERQPWDPHSRRRR